MDGLVAPPTSATTSAAASTTAKADSLPQEQLHPAAVLAALAVPFEEQGRRPLRCRSQLIARSRSRPVFAYHVICQDRATGKPYRVVVIGKGYNRGDGQAVFALMRRVWDASRSVGLRMPQPLAYISDPPLLLQTAAPPRTLAEHLAAPENGLGDVRRSAQWLSQLHALTVADAPAWGIAEEQRKLREYADGLVVADPERADRLRRLCEATLAALRAAPPVAPVLTHGDFQPKNIHVGSDFVVVIDYDRSALGHPARDVGHFVGQGATMSYARTGSFTAIQAWLEAFRDEYRRRAGGAGQAAEAALPAYVARTFVEILYYKLCVKPVRDASFVPVWLAECERWLESPAKGRRG